MMLASTRATIAELEEVAHAYPNLPILMRSLSLLKELAKFVDGVPRDVHDIKQERDALLHFRAEVSARVGCSSPDGDAELDQIEMLSAQARAASGL